MELIKHLKEEHINAKIGKVIFLKEGVSFKKQDPNIEVDDSLYIKEGKIKSDDIISLDDIIQNNLHIKDSLGFEMEISDEDNEDE